MVKPGSDSAAEFSFDCNEHTYRGAGSQFSFVSAAESPLPNGKVAYHPSAQQGTSPVAVVYSVYDGHPAIRKQLVLRNTGSAPLHV